MGSPEVSWSPIVFALCSFITNLQCNILWHILQARFFLVQLFFHLVLLPFSHDSGDDKCREELCKHHEEEVHEWRAQTYTHDISDVKRVNQYAALEAEEEADGQSEDPQVEAGVLNLVVLSTLTATAPSVSLGKNCHCLSLLI